MFLANRPRSDFLSCPKILFNLTLNSTCSRVSRICVDSVIISQYNYTILLPNSLKQISYNIHIVLFLLIAGIDYFTPHSLLYFGCMSILLAHINLSFKAFKLKLVVDDISYFSSLTY